MKKIFATLALITLVTVSFSSCSKYEEGSKFTILTKKQRLVNDWKTLKITADGNDITDLNIITEVIIRDNGTYTVLGSFFGVSTSDDGKWAFNGDKSNVIFTANNGNVATYEIIKLKNKELKVKTTDNGVEYIEEFVEK